LHAGFFGITRSGKTNVALVFVSRCIKALGAHALILDWIVILADCFHSNSVNPSRFMHIFANDPLTKKRIKLINDVPCFRPP